jgi:hypothetical protein
MVWSASPMKPLPDSNSRSFQDLLCYGPLVNTSGDCELSPPRGR